MKEAYFKEACAEYLKRLGAFGKAEVVELSEAKLPESPTDGEIKAALSREAEALRPYLSKKGALHVALCVEGEEMSSEELSRRLSAAAGAGLGTVYFYIGSSFGLAEEVKRECQLRLSISKMTLPHRLCRVVLLEQAYRALSIAAGTKYHK